MNLDDSPAEAEFRARARSWLGGHAPEAGSPDDFSHHYGVLDGEAEHEFLARSQAWQKLLADHGWAGISWPAGYGGQGGTAIQELIFAQEQGRFGVTTEAFDVGLRMIGPTIIEHCTDAQKDRYLAPMLRGDEIWCQLYSEPSAGSDLAGVRTTAVRDGDGWIVNGQKVWTSGAHYADWAMLLARTDPDVPKHRGLTAFFVDLRSPGIEIRPLRQMTGVSHFNEVFLDNLRIPAGHEMGAVNDGWRVVLTTLGHERAIIGGGHRGPSFAELSGLPRAAEFRNALVDVYISERVLDFLDMRLQTTLSRGELPGPAETSVKKIVHGEHINRAARLGLTLQGAAGLLVGGGWDHEVLNAPMYRIAGGTDEIQRNILAERVLGLPPERRVDKGVPFRELTRTRKPEENRGL